jgi:hypothetical protein
MFSFSCNVCRVDCRDSGGGIAIAVARWWWRWAQVLIARVTRSPEVGCGDSCLCRKLKLKGRSDGLTAHREVTPICHRLRVSCSVSDHAQSKSQAHVTVVMIDIGYSPVFRPAKPRTQRLATSTDTATESTSSILTKPKKPIRLIPGSSKMPHHARPTCLLIQSASPTPRPAPRWH